jgi:hypothetical protein
VQNLLVPNAWCLLKGPVNYCDRIGGLAVNDEITYVTDSDWRVELGSENVARAFTP